jgi:hypothetical protein
LLAERELRRLLHAPAHRDVTYSSSHWSQAADRRASSTDPAAVAEWTMERAGRILIAAGAVDEEFVHEVGSEIVAACTIRSPNRLLRGGMTSRMFMPYEGTARVLAAHPVRVVPIGQAVRLATERAPAELHFMSLASTPGQATIAMAIRMRWPPDGSSAEEELTGAGYHHLPYDRLWLADDRGRRYTVTFDGEGGTQIWRGVLRMSPAPPPGARWLDLVADETNRLIRLGLHQVAGTGTPAPAAVREDLAISPAERLLEVEAEAILADPLARRRGRPGQQGRTRAPGRYLGEITSALIEAGLITADNAAAGRLTVLCQRLGVPGPGPAVATAAARLPARWASVLAQRPVLGTGPELFAPLATVLPDLDGTRFALAGLSLGAGESHLHVVASGLPGLGERFGPAWRPGFSWWVRDGAGDWHLGVMAGRDAPPAGEAEFRVRLVPPLAVTPEAIEVRLGASSAAVRAVVPVRGARPMADT